MFVLNNIEVLDDDLANVPAKAEHVLTFKVIFTIFDVPDTFTGVVLRDQTGELQVQHYNNPKGNKRKVITLKNKLKPGQFEKIKSCLFAISQNEPVDYPLVLETVNPRASRMAGG